MAIKTASENAVGLIETRGIVALTAGIEAMMKTADVECVAVERVSSGYFAAAVQGSIAAVRQALDSGTAAVKRYGELRSAQMYPRPHDVSARLLENGTRKELESPTGAAGLGQGDG
jgi:ethanolamine utilization protein EutM